MSSLKDKLYQYRLLVIIVCICLIGGCGYGLYKSFNKKDDSYVTHVKDGDSEVVKTGDVTITKDDLYEYFLDNDGLNMTLNSAINYVADQEITDEDAINSKVEELKQTVSMIDEKELSEILNLIRNARNVQFAAVGWNKLLPAGDTNRRYQRFCCGIGTAGIHIFVNAPGEFF